MGDQFRSLITALTFKSSHGEVKMLSCEVHNASLRRITRIVKRTLLWRATARSQSASSTQTKCLKSVRVIKHANGNIGDQDVTSTRVVHVGFIFTSPIIRTNVFMLAKSSTFEFLRTIGYIMAPLFVHHARSCVVNNSP